MNKLVTLVNATTAFGTENKEEIYTAALVLINVALYARSYKLGKSGTELSFGNRLVTSRFWYNMGKR